MLRATPTDKSNITVTEHVITQTEVKKEFNGINQVVEQVKDHLTAEAEKTRRNFQKLVEQNKELTAKYAQVMGFMRDNTIEELFKYIEPPKINVKLYYLC
ncbi:MAG: hypothetical protein MRQ09_04080 [Candidatus Midichloria sp.]|nr:hypothetical protein [Candidatus Midichloria sp.]